MRRLLPLLIALALTACGGGSAERSQRAAQEPGPTATPTSTPAPRPSGPAAAAAAELTEATTTLRAELRAWLAEDGDTGPLPQEVLQAADRHQELLGLLADRPRLAARVIPLLHGRIRAETRDVLAARRAIAVLNRPVPGDTRPRPRLRIEAPEPAAVIRGHYRAARRRFGVGMPLLAAVHLVETRFGRYHNNSIAGAQGPMQFIPATWAAYGLGGDVHDPRDAILGAANYLRANGAPGDPRRALFHYNPSWLYVEAVSRYARRLRRDPLAFYVFYAWPVRGR